MSFLPLPLNLGVTASQTRAAVRQVALFSVSQRASSVTLKNWGKPAWLLGL
jgi:hypothetical protein